MAEGKARLPRRWREAASPQLSVADVNEIFDGKIAIRMQRVPFHLT